MSDTTSSSGGIGLPTLLGVLFIGLKLGGVITWPWLWVLAPFWISAAIVIIVMLAVVIIALLDW